MTKLEEILDYVKDVTSTGTVDPHNITRNTAIKALWHVKFLAETGVSEEKVSEEKKSA